MGAVHLELDVEIIGLEENVGMVGGVALAVEFFWTRVSFFSRSAMVAANKWGSRLISMAWSFRSGPKKTKMPVTPCIFLGVTRRKVLRPRCSETGSTALNVFFHIRYTASPSG